MCWGSSKDSLFSSKFYWIAFLENVCLSDSNITEVFSVFGLLKSPVFFESSDSKFNSSSRSLFFLRKFLKISIYLSNTFWDSDLIWVDFMISRSLLFSRVLRLGCYQNSSVSICPSQSSFTLLIKCPCTSNLPVSETFNESFERPVIFRAYQFGITLLVSGPLKKFCDVWLLGVILEKLFNFPFNKFGHLSLSTDDVFSIVRIFYWLSGFFSAIAGNLVDSVYLS